MHHLKYIIIASLSLLLALPEAQASMNKNEIVVLSTSKPYEKEMSNKAFRLGRWIARNNYQLVTVASNKKGNFNALIEGAITNGGSVSLYQFNPKELSGLLPSVRNDILKHNRLNQRGAHISYKRVSLLHTYHPSKHTSAVILFPGDMGALKAFFDIAQKNRLSHKRPTQLIVYNAAHYWDGLKGQLNHINHHTNQRNNDALITFVENNHQLAKALEHRYV